MNFLFKNEIIDYDFINNKKEHTILFLHGWGGNKLSFNQTINLTKRNFNILTLTMPTISQTCLSWNMFDYTELIINILNLNNIVKPIIVCHSFGFRVATLLNKKIEIEKIIVTGGAGPKKINIFKKIDRNNNKILLKQPKFKFLYKKVASSDYRNLSTTNKKTFNNIVTLNLINETKFNCPILLFWGTNDRDTPIWIARHIKKNNNTRLITTNSNHFAYLQESAKFNNEVLKFLKNVKN